MILSGILILLAIGIAAGIYLQHPKFGPPDAMILNDKVASTTNYRNGQFHNQIPTQVLTSDTSTFKLTLKWLFEQRPSDLYPSVPIPTVKTDLKSLDSSTDLVIWLGHSSFYLQIAGQRILIDPVFSRYASPLPVIGKAFAGTSIYQADDIPALDLLLITHSHWDHLDYASVTALQDKTGRAVTGLGVGAYLRYWGYPGDKVQELDWDEELTINTGLTVTALPARHYTQRLFQPNKTLWVSYALVSKEQKMYFSGDSGYGPHFSSIGKQFEGFDFAALDSGQYNPHWPFMHMTPEQAATAATDLQATTFLPIHIGRFSISDHTWYEPFDRVKAASKDSPFLLLNPKIGEVMPLDELPAIYSEWWKDVE